MTLPSESGMVKLVVVIKGDEVTCLQLN